VKVDLDDLEFFTKRAFAESVSAENWQDYCRATNPETMLELIYEIRRLNIRNSLLDDVSRYADSICGMLRQGGWPGKADALESRIKAVIDFDERTT
jgi:hypothetical protein